MNIDTTHAQPVYAYNSDGKKHRVPFDIIQSVEQELADANSILEELREQAFNDDGSMTSHDAITAMDEQEGYVTATIHLLSWLRSDIDSL